MGYGVLIILAVILLIVGPILGMVAFGRTRSLENRLRVLETRLAVAGQSKPTSERTSDTPSSPDVSLSEAETPPTAPPKPSAKPQPVEAPGSAIAEFRSASQATSSTVQEPTEPRPNVFASLESSLSGNWMVWLGAIALALGGAFKVKAMAALLPPMRWPHRAVRP